MKNLLVLLLTIISSVTFSQKNLNIENDNNVYSSAGLEIQPEYPGGFKAFAEFLSKNYKLPNVKGLQGRVFVEFIVEKDGSLGDIKVIRDIGFGTGEEAIRVLKGCPIWKPGEQFGKLVRVRYALPIMVDVK